jgi:hypothetical protein
MNIKSIFSVACPAITIAVAMPAAAHDTGDKVTLTFEHAIPDIHGKSLVALVVDSTAKLARFLSPAPRSDGTWSDDSDGD